VVLVEAVVTDTLPVAEVYGPVYQGEGPHTGRPAWFVRLGLCNLHCSWCDTPYTWDTAFFDVTAECPPTTPEQVAAQITDPDTLVVLTGGEPLIHQGTDALRRLLGLLRNPVHVETNGTLSPVPWLVERVEFFAVSPKVNPQGDPSGRRIHLGALAKFARLARTGHAAFKVVCRDPQEVAMVVEWADGIGVPRNALWVMPEGTDANTVTVRARAMEQTALDHRVSLTLRTHVLLHGKERRR